MAKIDPIDNMMQFQQNAINLRAFRQQLLASNIANADTPGYKARDIDFAATLREMTSGQSVGLRTTNERHLSGAIQGGQGGATPKVLYRGAVQDSIDGNSVDMDVERNHFAENALHYDANLTFLNSQLKLMTAAMQG